MIVRGGYALLPPKSRKAAWGVRDLCLKESSSGMTGFFSLSIGAIFDLLRHK